MILWYCDLVCVGGWGSVILWSCDLVRVGGEGRDLVILWSCDLCEEHDLSPRRYREIKPRSHGGAPDFCSLGNIDRMQWKILVILWYWSRCCSQFHHQPTCGGPVYSCCCFTAQFSARQMEDKNTGSSAPHLKYQLQTQLVLLKQLVSPNQLWKAIFIIVEKDFV